MKELVSVIVPILNPQIDPTEEKLLHHCLETLNNYPLIFVTYEGADLSIIKEHNPDIDVIQFPKTYFQTRQDLSRLLLTEDFYERFNWAEFLLVHELNSWIVRDELYYWCKQGYDYLRAAPVYAAENKFDSIVPRILGLKNTEKQAIGNAYNGNGLYLCRIERMVETLKSKKRDAYQYRHNESLPNADSVFWEIEANRFWPNLRKPTGIVQNYFAKNALDITGNKNLPFALTGISRANIHNLSYFQSLPEAE
jgi:hypothetical protein